MAGRALGAADVGQSERGAEGRLRQQQELRAANPALGGAAPFVVTRGRCLVWIGAHVSFCHLPA